MSRGDRDRFKENKLQYFPELERDYRGSASPDAIYNTIEASKGMSKQTFKTAIQSVSFTRTIRKSSSPDLRDKILEDNDTPGPGQYIAHKKDFGSKPDHGCTGSNFNRSKRNFNIRNI